MISSFTPANFIPSTKIAGITISGLPAGEYINSEETERYLRRLSPKSLGNVRISMPRIMSGIENERTTGGALCAVMKIDAPAKKAEDTPKNYRFGHADYTGAVCNRGYCDTLEKSRTAEIFAPPICFVGAICGQILERRGIYTAAHALRIHNVKDNPFDAVRLDRDGIICVRSKDFPVINDKNGWKMLETISAAADADETLGGIVECASINVPSGVGSPVFNGLTNNIAQLLYMLEIQTAIAGELYNINTFDQPGVEAYKKNMFALLGKKVFEERAEDLRKRIE